MKSILLVMLIMASGTILAEVKIQIASTPKLPLINHVKNSKFTAGLKSWQIQSETQASVKDGVLTIKGNEKVDSRVSQKIAFNEPVPAGAEILVMLETSSESTDNELVHPGIAIYAKYVDGTNSYLSSPVLPNEPHEWVESKKIITAKKDIAGLELHICYYKQTGSLSVRSVVVKTALGKVSVNVNGRIKNVKVYNSAIGIIDNTTSSLAYSKKFVIIPGSAYYVEAVSNDGKIYTKRYPENAFLPSISTNDAIAVFKRFDNAIIAPQNSEHFTFSVPASTKKAILSFEVRLTNPAVTKVSGYTQALSLTLNGKKILLPMLVERTKAFTRMDGVITPVYGAAFVVFYSPWSYTLGEDNDYCPVAKVNRNPFIYKFDVSDIIQQGENILAIYNNVEKTATPYFLYVHDAKISTE